MKLRFVIACALLFGSATWLLRAPGLDRPIWNVDEAVTFTMAQQILHGEVPYRDAVDQRTPLAPYAQSAVFALCGDWNLHAQHVALVFVIAATAVLVLLIARELQDSATGVAAGFFAVLLCYRLPTLRDAMPAHTAWYLILFSSLGYYCLARGWRSHRARWGVAAGVSFGCAWLAKQPALLDAAAAIVLLALAAAVVPTRRRLALQLGAGLLASLAVIAALTAGFFAAHGAWEDYLYYTWTYNNTLYVPDVPRAERWETIRVPFALLADVSPALLVLAAAAAIALLAQAIRKIRHAGTPGSFDFLVWMILGWSASGLVSTTLSGRGFSHYSIQLIPGLSLACGWLTALGVRRAWHWADGRRGWQFAICTMLISAFAALLPSTLARYRDVAVPESTENLLADLIRAQSSSEDRIHVWGYSPDIYAISGRLPATRFLYNTFVTGMIPWTNLDPQKNTDYAVVPGAREKFLADWRRHPPELVIDTGAMRGFLKYPLHQQSWIWPLIAEHYAQIATEQLEPHGCRLFKRLEDSSTAGFPGHATTSDAVQILSFPADPTRAAGVTVRVPAGTRWIDLYLDEDRVRRMRCSNVAPHAVTFYLSAPDSDGHRVRAVAHTANAVLASTSTPLITAPPRTVIGGPPLQFGEQRIPALASSTITGAPILPKKETPHRWDAHAPARLVYPWLPGMNSLAFAYGIEEFALAQEPPRGTDGVEVVVQVEERDGRIIPVYRHYLDRELARRANGHTVEYTPLPPGEHARIIMLLTPGPLYDLAFDWSYWLWIRADPSPLVLLAGRTPLYPQRIEATAPLRPSEVAGSFVTTVGAPSTIEFGAGPELAELSGTFGIPDAAWLGDRKTGPVDFLIELVRANGERKKILTRRLDPANRAEDRGVRPFRVTLPQPVDGLLRFTTQATTDPALAEAFWGGLLATTTDFALHGEAIEIPPTARSRSDFGFQAVTLDGQPSIFAHVSSTLVYPWSGEMHTLEAGYGLLPGAYAEGQVSDGAQFIVETEDAAGTRREIFRRFLDPSQKSADRGAQTLRLPIPPLPGGHLILRTVPAPSGRITNAWSYWSSLRIKP